LVVKEHAIAIFNYHKLVCVLKRKEKKRKKKKRKEKKKEKRKEKNTKTAHVCSQLRIGLALTDRL